MHTHFKKGTTLFIKLKSGQVIIGKFLDHKSGVVILKNSKKINIADINIIAPRKLDLINQQV